MAVIKAVSSKAGIGHAIDYVTKKEKTEEKLVSGLHCEPETVKEEMQATKELWGKTDGRTYKHYVQSYHEDEKITPEQAHKNAVELAEHTKALLQDAISGEIGSLKDEVKENTVQEVRKALQANIEAIQRATKLLEKQSDTLTSVMKQKIRELEESKNSFFRYEGLKLYLFWGGMVCNILVFLMLLYGMLGK